MIETGASAVRLFLFVGGIIIFLFFELTVPYRSSSVSKWRRWMINLGLTFFNTLILQVLFAGAIVSIASYVTVNRLGILYMMDLPQWIRILATVAFMDFMLYIWHLLNHEVPFFWRFHRVHHSDLNMDVSTATRFHVGELALSAIIRMGLLFFLGANPLGILVFESAIVLCAQFHHSSLKVPGWFEAVFWKLFVPPSMHRIHHSVVIKERNTNYGTIFSFWDRAFGTLLTDVKQDRLRIGMGAYQDPEKLGIFNLLAMPLTKAVR